jgi:hypothetical protein
MIYDWRLMIEKQGITNVSGSNFRSRAVLAVQSTITPKRSLGHHQSSIVFNWGRMVSTGKEGSRRHAGVLSARYQVEINTNAEPELALAA